MTLKVTHHDNRGDQEVPYGFVYFNDDSRLGYPEMENGAAIPNSLFKTNWENRNPTTSHHKKLARKHLKDQKVKGYE